MTTLTQTAQDGAATLDTLVRARKTFIDRLSECDVRPVARTLLIATLISAALFGACLGSYRGGMQTLYALIKFPLVIVLTAAFTVPALSGMKSALGLRTDVGRDAALVLAAWTLATLIMAAASPLLVLAMSHGTGYHATILLVVAVGSAGGVAGLYVLYLGLERMALGSRLLLLATIIAVFSLVGGELAWMLRPYLLRPSEHQPVFMRASEGSFFDAVSQSYDSARGIYRSER